MYLPEHFKGGSQEIACELMRDHAFASLIGNDDEGRPYVTHLPLHLETGPAQPRLLGHVAKGNPHWRHLQARPAAMVTFLGPHAYMSPRVYADKARVPTWNYLAVHAQVLATLVEEEDAKDAILKKLIGDHDPAYADQWRGLPEDFRRRMLGGIVAFELKIVDLQCKLKLNQHRPEAHAAMRASYAEGGEQERELAAWMDRLGLNGQVRA
jgi:transcriptional regulator